MIKIKKYICFVLLLLLCTTLIPGCGKSSDQEDTDIETEEEQKEDKKKKDDNDNDTSSPDDNASEQDAGKKLKEMFSKHDFSVLPVITFEDHNNQWFKDGSSQLLCDATYQTISIEDSDYQALSDALFSYSNSNAEYIYDMAQQCVDECYADTYLMDMIDEYMYYTFSNSYEHTRFDHQVLSIMESYEEYTMGPHGSYVFNGITFDVKTGNTLTLSDLIQGDFDTFADFAKDYMVADLLQREEYGFSPSELEDTISVYQLQEDLPWYLNGSGMVFIFNIYSIGPYAMGSMEVCIPYTQLTDYLKPEYLPGEGTYIGKLSPDVASCYRGFDQDADVSSSYEVYINTNSLNSYGEDEGFCIETANSNEMITEYGYLASAYIVRKSNEEDYLLLCYDNMSSDYSTVAYSLKDGNLTELSVLSGVWICEGSVFEQQIIGSMLVDILGTYFTRTPFIWNEDHSFTQKEDILHFDINPWLSITTIEPLPVIINGEHTYLPVGTTIEITGCAGNDTAFFRIKGDENTTGEIKQDRSNGFPYLIDGRSEYEYFEFLPYAG